MSYADTQKSLSTINLIIGFSMNVRIYSERTNSMLIMKCIINFKFKKFIHLEFKYVLLEFQTLIYCS